MARFVSVRSEKEIRRMRDRGDQYEAEHDSDLRVALMRSKTCVYCWRVSEKWLHIDHIEPLSRGGENRTSNTAHVCQYCNLSKGNRFLLEWVLSGRAPVVNA